MTLPDCPRRGCDAADSLEKIRADTNGLVWAYCKVCSATVLFRADGSVAHVGAPQVGRS